MGRLEIQRSSLFRWLFTPLAGLEFVLQDREHLRRIFDDPVAVSDPVMASDMVVDRQSGIFFHAAELRSELDAASTDAALLDDLYCGDSFLDQKAKYLYLVDKFMAAVLHPDTLHVFSDFHQDKSLLRPYYEKVWKSFSKVGIRPYPMPMWTKQSNTTQIPII